MRRANTIDLDGRAEAAARLDLPEGLRPAGQGGGLRKHHTFIS